MPLSHGLALWPHDDAYTVHSSLPSLHVPVISRRLPLKVSTKTIISSATTNMSLTKDYRILNTSPHYPYSLLLNMNRHSFLRMTIKTYTCNGRKSNCRFLDDIRCPSSSLLFPFECLTIPLATYIINRKRSGQEQEAGYSTAETSPVSIQRQFGPSFQTDCGARLRTILSL